MNFQQIGHMAILKHHLLLLRLKLEEYVTRKQGFLKRHSLPPVLVHGSIAREGRQNSLSFAALFQLLLSPWTRVRHEPFQITHFNHYAGDRADVKQPNDILDPVLMARWKLAKVTV
jgi:hypothetical protein